MPRGRILVLDDNALFVQLLYDLLTFEDFDVITLDLNGAALDQRIAEQHPDLILMDIHMPGMDGRSICYHLKQQAGTQDIRIILMSGTVDLQRAQVASGADAVMSKPFPIDDLLLIIRQLLGS